MDSKPISILFSIAGLTCSTNVTRYDTEAKGKTALPFPNAFKVYNCFMGGIDLHNQHCNNLMSLIRAKRRCSRRSDATERSQLGPTAQETTGETGEL